MGLVQRGRLQALSARPALAGALYATAYFGVVLPFVAGPLTDNTVNVLQIVCPLVSLALATAAGIGGAVLVRAARRGRPSG